MQFVTDFGQAGFDFDDVVHAFGLFHEGQQTALFGFQGFFVTFGVYVLQGDVFDTFAFAGDVAQAADSGDEGVQFVGGNA